MGNRLSSMGIIGGAGPTAGAYLFQKIIAICQECYHCKRDADFPRVILQSYPFADMLGEEIDRNLIEEQLKTNLSNLIANKVEFAAIACNTLHGFLPKKIDGMVLVHIIEETKKFLLENNWKKPLILCSSTASKSKLHANYFECYYPEAEVQRKIDDLIVTVTAGCCLKEASSKLSALIEKNETVVLGCTELSVIHETEPLRHAKVCNPHQIIAEKMCALAFNLETAIQE